MRKVITKIVYFIFFLNASILHGQIPTELNHLSNIVAKRLAVRGEIDLKYFDQNYMSSVDLNKLFGNQNRELIIRSIWDINIPNQDNSELISKKKNRLISRFDALKNKNLEIKKFEFGGRLADYAYYDMDMTISAALKKFEQIKKKIK